MCLELARRAESGQALLLLSPSSILVITALKWHRDHRNSSVLRGCHGDQFGLAVPSSERLTSEPNHGITARVQNWTINWARLGHHSWEPRIESAAKVIQAELMETLDTVEDHHELCCWGFTRLESRMISRAAAPAHHNHVAWVSAAASGKKGERGIDWVARGCVNPARWFSEPKDTRMVIITPSLMMRLPPTTRSTSSTWGEWVMT